MSRHRPTGSTVDFLFRVAMVGNDEGGTAGRVQCIDNLTQTRIDGFDGFDGCGNHSCVAHHVAVREVHHDESMPAAFDRFDDGLAHTSSAHLRLQVIGRDLW